VSADESDLNHFADFSFDQISDFTMFSGKHTKQADSAEFLVKSSKMTTTYLDATDPKLTWVCSPALTDPFAINQS
jgi:hypothetical protein